MIIEHNKKVKLNNPTTYPSGSKTKPNPTLGKPTPAPQQVHQHSQDEPPEEPPSDISNQTLVNKCLAESGIDPTDIQNVMSVSYAKRNISSHESSRQIQTHQRYVFARVDQANHQLIDMGANGGLAGADMRIIHTTPRKLNIVGIDDHELTGLNVVTAATLLDTQKGPIIGVFHEYAHLGKGRSIHAAGQMEWLNCQVDDRSKLVGGTQSIQTSEGYVIPLSIYSGLVYMHSMRIPTDHDLQNYPHAFFTSPDFGILQYWTMGYHNLSLRTLTNTLMLHCSKAPILMHMENPITYLLYLLGSISLMFTCMAQDISKPQIGPTKRGGSTTRSDI